MLNEERQANRSSSRCDVDRRRPRLRPSTAARLVPVTDPYPIRSGVVSRITAFSAITRGRVPCWQEHPMPSESSTTVDQHDDEQGEGELVQVDLLIEDVSIDGMCGVY